MSTSPEQQARECEGLAEQDVDKRVQYLCEAAECWHMSGADERARELFERALAAEGHAAGDERVVYARFLFEAGDTGRAHELLEKVRHSRELDGSAYHAAAGLFEGHLDDLATAMHWYTGGVELAGNGDYVPWPPGRNDFCWCGSTRRYKKCCGAPVSSTQVERGRPHDGERGIYAGRRVGAARANATPSRTRGGVRPEAPS